jgi:hypothetical protein
MAINVQQHEAFHDGLAAFEAYMANVQGKAEKFDSKRARQLVKNFAEPMVEHLHAEVKLLLTISSGTPLTPCRFQLLFRRNCAGLNRLTLKQ